jgi:predicted DNA-binding protein
MARTENGIYTSIYLGAEVKERLVAMSDATGASRSKVIQDLIMRAGSEDRVRLMELVKEMSELLSAT